MAQCTIKPDMEFVRALEEAGGESLKKCYQCATCSVACPLAPATRLSAPRKWSGPPGASRTSSAPMWTCGSATTAATARTLCPRGARPADLMGAARNVIYKELTEPVAVGKLMSKPSGLPVLFAIPALLWLVVWWIRAGFNGGNWFPPAPLTDASSSARSSTATTPLTPSSCSRSSARCSSWRAAS